MPQLGGSEGMETRVSILWCVPGPTAGRSAMCHCKLHCRPEYQDAINALIDINDQVSFLALNRSSVPFYFLCLVQFHVLDTCLQKQTSLLGYGRLRSIQVKKAGGTPAQRPRWYILLVHTEAKSCSGKCPALDLQHGSGKRKGCHRSLLTCI